METRELEFESRAILTEKQYHLILDYFINTLFLKGESLEIVNDYFDTDDFSLKQNKMMLRIRNSYDLTMKVPSKEENGDYEYHQFLDEDSYEKMIKNIDFPEGKIKTIISEFGVSTKKVKYLTSLHCSRVEFKIDDLIIALDKNSYNNKIDFNIEIESDSLEKSQNKNLELAKLFNYDIEVKCLSKFLRVINSLKD